MTTPLVYRINVTMAKLGVSRSTVYRLIEDGTLVRVKLGARACGVTAASVHAMIEPATRAAGDASNDAPGLGSQMGSQPLRVAGDGALSS